MPLYINTNIASTKAQNALSRNDGTVTYCTHAFYSCRTSFWRPPRFSLSALPGNPPAPAPRRTSNPAAVFLPKPQAIARFSRF